MLAWPSLSRNICLFHNEILLLICYLGIRSRENKFTHMNCSTVDIPFLSEALSGERIGIIFKVGNLMRKVLVIATGGEEEEEGEKIDLKFA